jgi:hypothetical protein
LDGTEVFLHPGKTIPLCFRRPHFRANYAIKAAIFDALYKDISGLYLENLEFKLCNFVPKYFERLFVSPSDCREVKIWSLVYCDNQKMPCRNGCEDWQHLNNQPRSMTCKGNGCSRIVGVARAAATKSKKVGRSHEDEAFWEQGKEKRKAIVLVCKMHEFEKLSRT